VQTAKLYQTDYTKEWHHCYCEYIQHTFLSVRLLTATSSRFKFKI